MSRVLAPVAALLTSGFAVWACATASVPVDTTDLPETSVGVDSGGVGVDSGGCAFDTMTDPKHCGSCTTACANGQVCSSGACKNACDAPTTKCTGDAGIVCADLTKDPAHCGGCTTACSAGDAGGLAPGNGNPDSGIPTPDGGYDGGIGWAPGTPTCAGSTCGVSCGNGLTACSDNVCYDTNNFHDHCGDCNTACAADTEWCTGGKCCATGMANCSGTCTDVLGDAKNCGGCGIACPVNAPACAGGVCTTAYSYTETFTSGQVPTQQCNDWKTYISKLGNSYTSVTLKGTLDPVGITCSTPAVVNGLAQALKNGTVFTGASCNGHVWTNCNRYNDELWIDPPSTCSGANCPNPGYLLRACFGSANIWGSVKGNTCAAPTQTITLSFQ